MTQGLIRRPTQSSGKKEMRAENRPRQRTWQSGGEDRERIRRTWTRVSGVKWGRCKATAGFRLTARETEGKKSKFGGHGEDPDLLVVPHLSRHQSRNLKFCWPLRKLG